MTIWSNESENKNESTLRTMGDLIKNPRATLSSSLNVLDRMHQDIAARGNPAETAALVAIYFLPALATLVGRSGLLLEQTPARENPIDMEGAPNARGLTDAMKTAITHQSTQDHALNAFSDPKDRLAHWAEGTRGDFFDMGLASTGVAEGTGKNPYATIHDQNRVRSALSEMLVNSHAFVANELGVDKANAALSGGQSVGTPG